MNFNDPYEDIITENVIYTTENIPTKDTEEYFNDFFSQGCECEDLCTLENKCSCLLKYGINYKIISNQNTNLYIDYILNTEKLSYGLYECNNSCKCKNKFCGNRLVQFGPRNDLRVLKCNQKGFGLFTTKKIFKGSFICEYASEIISNIEAAKRFQHNKENKLMNYIICLQEHFGNSLKSTFIDPSYFGNIGRFINHSCNPNCELIPVRINNIVPKLAIFAKNDIEAHCELTFDYGDGKSDNISDKTDLKLCLCNELNCRKFMPYNVNIGK